MSPGCRGLRSRIADRAGDGRWLADEFGVNVVAVAAIIAGSGVTGAGTTIDRA